MRRKIGAGTTGVMLPIFVQDTSSTTGGGLAGLVFNTAGLVAEYRRQGQSAWTAITLAAGTLGTWSSGGFVADGALSGAYEVGLPDAVLAAGARWAIVRLRGAANMLPVLVEFELDAVNYQDGAAFGLSRIDATISSVATAVAAVPAAAAAAVWAAGTRTLTSFGTLVADAAAAVWAYATRRLTMTASDVADQLDDTTLTIRRGDTWEETITGLGAIDTTDDVWLTVKRTKDLDDSDDDDDELAIVQLRRTVGLVRLNGEAATTTNGSLTVTDAVTGSIAASLVAGVSKGLSRSENLRYDVQVKTAAGAVRTKREGNARITSDVTRSVA